MKIGLLGLDDPSNIRTYSGTPYHLMHYLRKAGHEVRPLGPYPIRRLRVQLENKLRRAFTGRHLIHERHPHIVRQFAGIIDAYLDRNPDLDVLLATSLFYVAGAQAGIPIMAWGDTTVAGVLGKYERYFNLSERTVRECHEAEQQGFGSCDLAIFSSCWAADVARTSYSLDPAKLRVIPYGANLLAAPDDDQIFSYLKRRPREILRFVLIGVNWTRKGVNKAIAVTREMRRRGYDARLEVVGCYPPAHQALPEYVSIAGAISKATEEGRTQIANILGTSHLLILPTIAECAAVVLSEASAFGVPALTTDVGGNASLIQPGLNGYLIHPEAEDAEWADRAEMLLGSAGAPYEEMVWRTVRFFRKELTWEQSVVRFEREVQALTAVERKNALVSAT